METEQVATVAKQGGSPLPIRGSETASSRKYHIQKIKAGYSKFTKVDIRTLSISIFSKFIAFVL